MEEDPVEGVTICHTEPVIAEEVQTVQPEYITPVLTMSPNDKETIVRMLGYIEGLATGVINERMREGLYTAVETIFEALDKGGKA